MKNINLLVLSAVLAGMLPACGDNKTTEKLLGTDVLTSTSDITIGGTNINTGIQTSASVTAQCATMSAKATAPTGFFFLAPSRFGITPPSYEDYLQGPDNDGYYTYPDASFSASTIKIKFMDASNDPIDFDTISGDPGITTINVLITSTYQGGTFAGDYTIDWSVTPAILDTGTIDAIISSGITFHAVITDMTFEKTTTNLGIPIGLPISGSMTATSPSGWGGILTYTKSGSSYICTGTIAEDDEERATVHLTYNITFGNYTGSYVDLNTGETHTIQ